MLTTYQSQSIQQVNSGVSYPDMLGLYLGLTRFVGETNASFLQRLYLSSTALKDTTLIGLIDTLRFNLNLNIQQGISITGPVGSIITLYPGILLLFEPVSGGGVPSNRLSPIASIPLFNLAADTYMEWYKLSQIVTNINRIPGWTANLLCPDTTAITLCKQTNLDLTINEVVNTNNSVYTVSNAGLVSDSLIFSFTPPAYSINKDTITFASNPTSGLTISYQSIITPYNLVSSDINLISLSEPNLIGVATNSNNVVGYQIQQALQAIMAADASYWTV